MLLVCHNMMRCRGQCSQNGNMILLQAHVVMVILGYRYGIMYPFRPLMKHCFSYSMIGYRPLPLTFVYANSQSHRAVGIATGHGLDGRGVGVRIPVEVRILSSTRRSDRFWPCPASCTMGIWGLFPPGVWRPRREADHSPPTSAEVENTWIYTFTPQYVFIALCLIS
jgi:hypothetical protein